MRPIASVNRRGEAHSASQPSPSCPVRASAASERPPTRTGIGVAGAGRIAPLSSKNRPRKSTCSPDINWRTHRSASVVRAPRWRGSIPHSSSSDGIVPAHADPEGEPARGEQSDRGELTRDDRGMAQGDEIDARLHGHVRIGREERRGLDQAVRPVTVGEADVVADGQVVDSRPPPSARRARATGRPRRRGPAHEGRSRLGRALQGRGRASRLTPRRRARPSPSRLPADRRPGRRRGLRRTRG